MIKKLTLTGIWRNTQDKNGNPLRGANGKDYERVSIQAKEYGTTYLSGFGGRWNQEWKKDDVITVKVEQVESKGKTYLNFSRVDELEMRVIKLEDTVNFLLEGKQAVKKDVLLEDEPPMDEIDPENTPF